MNFLIAGKTTQIYYLFMEPFNHKKTVHRFQHETHEIVVAGTALTIQISDLTHRLIFKIFTRSSLRKKWKRLELLYFSHCQINTRLSEMK